MTALCFDLPPVPTLPVHGDSRRYQVGRIFCVGRNYAAHIREMGLDPNRETPFFFTKPSSATVLSGAEIPYALGTQDFQYEMELVVAIGAPAFRVPAEKATAAVFAYGCGLDMTRRDLQMEARKTGRPWDLGKAFEKSAVCGELFKASDVGHFDQGDLSLTVNGQVKQKADLKQMVWSVPELISYLSQYYHLEPGDLIFTGTPEGVGPVQAGDQLVGTIAKVGEVRVKIGPAE